MVCADCERAIHPIPLDSVTTCSNEGGCTACAQAVELETQVVRTMESLKNLLTKLSAQRQVVNHAHSSIIHKMPVEMMSQIFTFVTHPAMPSHSEVLPHHSVPMKLGQVCKAWRSIAWSTPSVWTQLAVDLELPCTPLRVQHVGEFLARAKKCDIALSLSLNSDIFASTYTLDMYRPLFKQIATFSQRYTCLTLNMPEPLLELFCSMMPSFRRVYEFDVCCHPDRLLDFMTINPSHYRWKHLTVLRLEGVTVTQCVKFIQSAPRLEVATFLRVIWKNDMPAPALGTLQHITHKYLSILIVRVSKNDTVPAHNLFSYLTLPRLTFLDYSVSTRDQALYQWQQVERLRDDEFLEFVKRSAGRLEYLQVRGVGWNYDFLASVLREVPSITHLGVHSRCTIGNKYIANSLLDHLACTVIQPEEELDLALLLVPRLQHLTFYSERNSSPKVSWDLVSKCFGHAFNHQLAPAAYRRLKSLVVQCHGGQYQRRHPYIDKGSLLRLIELRKAGAEIAYWFTGHESDCSSDFFTASMKFHGLNEETRGEEATEVKTQ